MATKKKSEDKPTGLFVEAWEGLADDDDGEYIYYADDGVLVNDDPNYLDSRHFFRSGIEVLDRLIGTREHPGLGSGKMTELFGRERSGKSATACAYAHHTLQHSPEDVVVYIDMERALTKERLKQYPLFINNPRCAIICPATLEQALMRLQTVLRKAQEKKLRVLAILDSVAASRTDSERKAAVDGKRNAFSDQAIILSVNLPLIRSLLSKTNSHLLMLNQTRDKPNAMAFSADNHTPGGNAIRFYADYRIRTTNVGKYSLATGTNLAADARPSGMVSQVQVIKNKVGIAERKARIPLIYMASQGFPTGLSDLWSIFLTLADAKLLQTKGGKYYFPASIHESAVKGAKGISPLFLRIDWHRVYRGEDEEMKPLHQCMQLALSTWGEMLHAPDLDDKVFKVTAEEKSEAYDEAGGDEEGDGEG